MLRRLLILIALLLLWTPAGAALVADTERNGVFYLLDATPGAANPNRLLRYDSNAGQWLGTIVLPAAETPRGLAVHASGIFIAFDRSTYRYSFDGTTNTFVANSATSNQSLQILGDVLVIVSTGYLQTALATFDANSLVLLASGQSAYPHSCNGASAAPAMNRIFCRTSGISPADIIYVNIAATGAIGTTTDSPYHGAYPDANRTWVFPDGARVADSAGLVYATTSLQWLGSFGGQIEDLAFVGDVPVVLRAGQLVAYTNALLEAGGYALGAGTKAIFGAGDKVYAFAETSGSYTVQVVPLSSFSGAQPGAAIDPTGLDYTPDAYAFDETDGVLYLLSKLHVSVFRWSVASGVYLPTLPLVAVPDYMALDAAHHAIYLGIADGKIKKLDVASGVETHFATLPMRPNGLAMAGDFVFASDGSGAWDTHYVFRLDGTIASWKDWNYYSTEYVWNAASHKMYFFRDGMSPNDLLSEAIDPVGGALGAEMDSPYHDGTPFMHPIRVNPDGSNVVLGTGRIFDTVTLAQTGALPINVIDAAWTNGELRTLRAGLDVVQLQRWGANLQPLQLLQLPGQALRLFSYEGKSLVARMIGARPRFDLIDTGNLPDGDADGVNDYVDNCPATPNANQADADLDGTGDACDPDRDGDGLPNDYESAIGNDPDLTADARQDRDGDGYDALVEYGRSTDPNVKTSEPAPLQHIAIGFDTGLPRNFFVFGAQTGWAATMSAGNGDAFSLRSQAASAGRTSRLTWRDVFKNGTVTLDVLQRGENSDTVGISVDGVGVRAIYAGAAWQTVSFDVTAGVHDIAVIFYNEGTNAGEAFIDNVKFDQYVEPDFDGDGVPDSVDNCPAHANPGQEDDDHDGVGNRCDDCTKVANPNQLDTNGDGYGNVCDADFNNDGVVNAPDLAYLRLAMGIPAYDGSPFQLYDLNQDGWVNIPDLVIFKSRWGTKAGPSGLKP